MKKEVVLNIPEPFTDVKHWLVWGLDPSVSCTGYAFLHVSQNHCVLPESPATTVAMWRDVGSVKPETTKLPVWLRAKVMASYLKSKLDENSADVRRDEPEGLGLLICMEAPTPGDDFLNRVNAVFHEHFFEGELFRRFVKIRILTVNASTLRSLMGLTKKGNNKGENIARAYDFLPAADYPNLDSDACDGVMLAMVARHCASVLMGTIQEIPPKFIQTLCDSSPVERGNGRNARITTKGLLHTNGQRPEYWYSYDRRDYEAVVRDAAQPKRSLFKFKFSI